MSSHATNARLYGVAHTDDSIGLSWLAPLLRESSCTNPPREAVKDLKDRLLSPGQARLFAIIDSNKVRPNPEKYAAVCSTSGVSCSLLFTRRDGVPSSLAVHLFEFDRSQLHAFWKVTSADFREAAELVFIFNSKGRLAWSGRSDEITDVAELAGIVLGILSGVSTNSVEREREPSPMPPPAPLQLPPAPLEFPPAQLQLPPAPPHLPSMEIPRASRLSDLKTATYSLPNYGKVKSVGAELERTRTGRAVLINLWATWCAPCKDELPRLAKLERRWSESVLFVTVARDGADRKGDVLHYLGQGGFLGRGLHYMEDEKAPLTDSPSLRLDQTLPRFLVYDRSGQLVKVLTGGIDQSRDVNIEALEKILNEVANGKPKNHQEP